MMRHSMSTEASLFKEQNVDKLTRRQVLRTGAGIVGGMAVTYSQAAPEAQATPTLAPDEPIRTGFIGIGGRGTGDLKAFLKQKGQQVVAVCDINPKNLNTAAELVTTTQGKAPDLYDKGPDDFKRLLERKDIHAIVTATPCFEHARIMLASLQADKHIYGEKP